MRTSLRAAAVGSLALACACGGSAPPAAAPMPEPVPGLPEAAPLPRADGPRSYAALDSGAMNMTVFVATSRRYVSSERPGDRYSGDDADQLQLATVSVNVPGYRVRGTGDLPRASSFSVAVGTAPDPQREFFVTSVQPTDSARFVARLGADLASSRSRDVLVFVHGYNSSFEDAVLRAAQFAADMSLDGTIVLFSWPSAASVASYVRDTQSARNAGYHLLRLMRGIVPAALPDRTHLLAHSMGSEVVGKAISLTVPADSTLRLGQAILAAPDIDARVFRREILPLLVTHSQRVTLYASSDDDALRASRSVNGVWRLGLGGDSLTVMNGMDTIDATRVRADAIGHTLFGNSAFLADLAALVGEAKPPSERRLLAVRRGDLTFWRFRGDGR